MARKGEEMATEASELTKPILDAIAGWQSTSRGGSGQMRAREMVQWLGRGKNGKGMEPRTVERVGLGELQ
eukprot:scaffold5960_cov141-Amphora_coffeaeformis.AAC.2